MGTWIHPSLYNHFLGHRDYDSRIISFLKHLILRIREKAAPLSAGLYLFKNFDPVSFVHFSLNNDTLTGPSVNEVRSRDFVLRPFILVTKFHEFIYNLKFLLG